MEMMQENSGANFNDLSVETLLSDMDHMKTGIAIYDENLTLVFANKTIRNYLPALYENLDKGLSITEAIIAQSKLVYPGLLESQYQTRAAYIVNIITTSGSLQLKTPTGQTLSSSYDRTSSGRYILTSKDITDSVVNEDQLAKARKDADNANQAKTEFLANMSHEIRTPLSGVYMAAQLLLQQLRGTNQQQLTELAGILVTSASHLSEIINDVLDLSKIEAGLFDITPEDNSLPELLKTLKKAQDTVADERGLELKLAMDVSLPERLIYDNARVRQCVTNLVSNALKFTKSGNVTIAATFDPQTCGVTIHVADTGIGIALSEHAQVFDHFAQSKRGTSNAQKGTGLGLAISRKFARLMGGDIKLVSEVGKGSIFTLTFDSQIPVFTETKVVSAA